jgi:hypothetical protein
VSVSGFHFDKAHRVLGFVFPSSRPDPWVHIGAPMVFYLVDVNLGVSALGESRNKSTKKPRRALRVGRSIAIETPARMQTLVARESVKVGAIVA